MGASFPVHLQEYRVNSYVNTGLDLDLLLQLVSNTVQQSLQKTKYVRSLGADIQSPA